MREFQVYYKELFIGRLLINEEGKYSYVLDGKDSSTCFLKGLNVAPALYTEQKDFSNPIPYFQVRIESNNKFKNLEIGFVTDDVRLKEM